MLVTMFGPAADGQPPAPVWRARYHVVIPSRTLVVLAWDNRFEHAEAPLFPPVSADPYPVAIEVKNLTTGHAVEYRVMYMGFEFDDAPYTYFVLPKEL